MTGRAQDIKQFLEWASEQNGRHDLTVQESRYIFGRFVAVCGNSGFEIPEDSDLDILVNRYVEENS
jgi:hypothetical protein